MTRPSDLLLNCHDPACPGPKARGSGFISRNNPDESAKNFFLACQAAGLPREETVVWNIVPWYIGDGEKIRPATREDIQAGLPYLKRLLQLLPRLEAVVLVGGKAQQIEPWLARERPDLHGPAPSEVAGSVWEPFPREGSDRHALSTQGMRCPLPDLRRRC